jgi:D-glycero-D-manno-heptose 1,7-bisphosphate phosphatase
MKKAVFLDKDGTLIVDVPYNADPEKIILEPGVCKALHSLSDAGYLLVVVSNQAGIAHGYFEEKEILIIRQKLSDLLAEEDVVLDGFYYCPHHPEGKIKELAMWCECRKPEPGLLFKAARELQIDLKHSWMIGDILNDIEAGNNAGCSTVLIDNGNETEWTMTPGRLPDYIADDLEEAAWYIISNEKQSKHEQYLKRHHR